MKNITLTLIALIAFAGFQATAQELSVKMENLTAIEFKTAVE